MNISINDDLNIQNSQPEKVYKNEKLQDNVVNDLIASMMTMSSMLVKRGDNESSIRALMTFFEREKSKS